MKKCAKGYMIWVVLLLLQICVVHVCNAEQVLYVKNLRVNLRSAPTTASDNVVSTVPENTPVTMIRRRGAWYEVRLPDGQQGWISQWGLMARDTVIPQTQPQGGDEQPVGPATVLPSPPQSAGTDDMVYIPAGTYRVGSTQTEIQQVSTQWDAKIDMFTDELNQRQITIAGFSIDMHEVTNAEYYEFVKATRYPPPSHWHDGLYPIERGDHPVIFVSWEDAAAYAQWAGKRLPTADEWEVAARGRTGRLFPWGASYTNQRVNVNYAHSSTVPVGSSSDDVSEFGVYDLGGNVMEWTMTPYQNSNDFYVVKGGSWVSEPFIARGANQTPSHIEYRLDHVGFRCVKNTGG